MLALAAALLVSACGGVSARGPALVVGAVTTVGALKLRSLNGDLNSPWGLAFLPDGRMLVTERAGRLKLLDAEGRTLGEIGGVPEVASSGQGGLLDVLVVPEGSNLTVLLSYSEPGSGSESGRAGTSVARARLDGLQLADFKVIYRQDKVSGNGHFGSRLVLARDGSLFVGVGERQKDSTTAPTRDNAQNPASSLGKVLHLRLDGSPVTNNPAWPAGSTPHLYSYGHRNIQGAALRPGTDELWVVEHGPQGGDELNRVQAGGNYGWPLVSYGCPYGSTPGVGCRIGGGVHAPTYLEPASYWVPTSIAPSGLMFYTGERFPQWRGQAFLGALAGQALWRVALDDTGREVERQKLADLGERVRDVRQGPDGWIYLLTDSGKLLRVES